VVLDAFEFYGSLSGQHVNWEIYSIYFGRITYFLFTWSTKRGDDFMTYLGFLLFIGAPRHCWLVSWADKIKSKLESWQGFTLSMTGRLSLITSVIYDSFLYSS